MLDIVFDVQTGFSDGMLQRHVEANRHYRPRIAVYANGPSALTAPRQWPCVAVNGAAKLFIDRPATYWMACDPQALVADFVTGREAVIYMPATKCHPDVFYKLEDAGAAILPWHVDDAGAKVLPSEEQKTPSAVSITICALGRLYQMGYRDFDLYGFDGCYMDGKDHAFDQPHSKEGDIEIETNGQVFNSTKTWACEYQDFEEYTTLLPEATITIHGDGMFATAYRERVKQ